MTNTAPERLVQLTVEACEFAREAHAGQVDKLGDAYFGHVERVARRVHGPRAIVVAYLHDVLEDTETTIEELRLIFPEWAVTAVIALTHSPKSEPRSAYYARVRGNDLALDVKLADIDENTDPRRLLRLPAGEMARLMKKYADALYVLCDDDLSCDDEDLKDAIARMPREGDSRVGELDKFGAWQK